MPPPPLAPRQGHFRHRHEAALGHHAVEGCLFRILLGGGGRGEQEQTEGGNNREGRAKQRARLRTSGPGDKPRHFATCLEDNAR